MKRYQVTITYLTPDARITHCSSVHYSLTLEHAKRWAQDFIQAQHKYTSSTYLKTEIKEFEFVRDIPVDF